MDEANKYWSGAFGGKRVPFEPKAIFLGFFAVVIFLAGIYAISAFEEGGHLVTRSVYACADRLGNTAKQAFLGIYHILPGKEIRPELLKKSPHWSYVAVVLLWAMLVWSFFSGAINRIVAYRVARDDSIGAKAALKFAWKHKWGLFLPPFVIVFIIGIFWGCNTLAGFLAQKIPVAGPIIFIPVFFLVLLSTLFIILLLIGLFFGSHLISSGVATESCDGGEAFINVLTFIYSRPWSYIFYHSLMIVSVIILIWLGGTFIDIAFESSLVSSHEPATRYQFDNNWQWVRVYNKENKLRRIYLTKDSYEKYNSQYQHDVDTLQLSIKNYQRDISSYNNKTNAYQQQIKSIDDDLKKLQEKEKNGVISPTDKKRKISYQSKKQELWNKIEDIEAPKSPEQRKKEIEKYESLKPLYAPEAIGMRDVWAYIQGVPVKTLKDEKNMAFEGGPEYHSMTRQDMWRLDKFWSCIGVALLIFYLGLKSIVLGYAFAYFCAASTMIYFMLRKEVEGTDFEEIWEDEIEEHIILPQKSKAKKNKGKKEKQGKDAAFATKENKKDKKYPQPNDKETKDGKLINVEKKENKPPQIDDKEKKENKLSKSDDKEKKENKLSKSDDKEKKEDKNESPKVDTKEENLTKPEEGTMAIPLIRRRKLERKDKDQNKDKDKDKDKKFMD